MTARKVEDMAVVDRARSAKPTVPPDTEGRATRRNNSARLRPHTCLAGWFLACVGLLNAEPKQNWLQTVANLSDTAGAAAAAERSGAVAADQTTALAEQLNMPLRTAGLNGTSGDHSGLMYALQLMTSRNSGMVPQAGPGLLNEQISAEQIARLAALLQAKPEFSGTTSSISHQSGAGLFAPNGAPGTSTAPIVVVRQDGQQAVMPPRSRQVRFVVSAADTFAEVMKSELIGAATQMAAGVAEQQMYEALYRHMGNFAVPYAAGGLLRGIGGRLASRRVSAQRGFEFDYLPGTNAGIELSSASPVEFIVSPPNPFATLNPVLVKTDVLSKEGIRILCAKQIEIRPKQSPTGEAAYDRAVVKTEKQAADCETLKNADGNWVVRSVSTLPSGEYALVFRTSKEGFDLLEAVYDFRLK